MKKSIFLFIFVLSLFSISCNSSQSSSSSGFVISGEIEGLRNKPVYVEKVSFLGNAEIIGQTKAEDGKFKIVMESNPGPGYFRVKIGRNSVYFILDGKEKHVEFEGKYTKFNNYNAKIKGSELTYKFSSILADMNARKIDAMKIKNIAEESDPLLGAVLVVNVFGARVDFLSIHKNILKKMKEKYPDLYLTKDYEKLVTDLEKQKARQEASAKIKVGMPAPDIAMPDPEGKIRKLSDLKGKIVLVDFWASWCRPCIRSFPELTRIYNKYKDKGFTVFSVSLDGVDSRSASRYPNKEALQKAKENSKKKWINAIKKYNLSWPNHVSDLDKWDCKAAAMYGVRSIPRTFLIDREGKIAAINPRYNLEEAINEVLQREKK